MSQTCRFSPKNCLVCGGEFTPKCSSSKTCSEECRRALKRQRDAERWQALKAARLEASRARCAVCGKYFFKKTHNQICCSHSCASKKKALDKRSLTAALTWTNPGSPGYAPITAAEAERLRRALGYESYGKATEAAMSRGQTLTQFLTIEAVAAGIDLEKEAST